MGEFAKGVLILSTGEELEKYVEHILKLQNRVAELEAALRKIVHDEHSTNSIVPSCYWIASRALGWERGKDEA
jgi:hypothetical protein